MSQIRLPYLGSNAYAQMSRSPNGYREVSGIEQYNGASVRNVNIVRIDALYNLDGYFKKETLDKYRQVIYHILSGHGITENKDTIMQSIEHLYKTDEIFRTKISKIFYFRDYDLESLSVYDALVKDVQKETDRVIDEILPTLPIVKILAYSKLYTYISVSKGIDMREFEHVKGMEVISRC